MNINSLAFLACRLFALYVLAQIFIWAAYVYNGPGLLSAGAAGSGQYSLFSVAPLASVVLAAFFWWRAEWLAGKIAGRHAATETADGLGADDVQTAGFAVAGMFLLADNLPSIAADLARMLTHQAGTYGAAMLPHYFREGIALIMALALIFGAGGFTRLLQKPAAGDRR